MTIIVFGFRWRVISRLVELGAPVSVAFHIGDRPDPASDPAPHIFSKPYGELYHPQTDAFDAALPRALAAKVRADGYTLFCRSIVRDGGRIYHRRDSWLDTKNLFENSFQYFTSLFKKNNTKIIIFSNGPHEGATVVAYYAAKALGLRTVLTTQSRFSDAFWAAERFEDLILTEKRGNMSAAIPITAAPPVPHDMKNIRHMPGAEYYRRRIWRGLNTAAKAISLSFLWNPRGFRKSIIKSIELDRNFALHNLPDHFYSQPKSNEKYVYFPLHLQPEMTTDTFGAKYADQLLAIEELRRRLPGDHWIYLKENPKQNAYMREPSFFHRLRAIPKTRYLPMTEPTFDLIRNCQMVATINGTAGWEALQMGKPVITFGVAWYQPLPGAFDWRADPDKAMADALNHQHDPEALEDAVERHRHGFWRGVVDKDYAELVPGYDETRNDMTVAESLVAYLKATAHPAQGAAS